MKIFLDTNVLLDLVAHRSGEASIRAILESWLGPMDRICVSYLSLADMSYILRKVYSADDMRTVMGVIVNSMKVLPGVDQHIYDLQKMNGNDIEDCLQILCAEYERCDAILTWNVDDFRGNTVIPVLTPDEFLARCRQ